MTQRIRSVAVVLAIGALILAGMVFKRGGISEAWEQNSGGLTIVAFAIAALVIRAWVRSNNRPSQNENSNR